MEVIKAQTKSLCYNNETCQFEMVLACRTVTKSLGNCISVFYHGQVKICLSNKTLDTNLL